VMAWNTAKMQAIFDRRAQSRSGAIPQELIARCAPTRTEGLNMRGVFQKPSARSLRRCRSGGSGLASSLSR
jgi:hypothetical protein